MTNQATRTYADGLRRALQIVGSFAPVPVKFAYQETESRIIEDIEAEIEREIANVA